jgi:hypothetical protein
MSLADYDVKKLLSLSNVLSLTFYFLIGSPLFYFLWLGTTSMLLVEVAWTVNRMTCANPQLALSQLGDRYCTLCGSMVTATQLRCPNCATLAVDATG